MYEKKPFSQLRSQLVIAFLASTLGIAIAIGIPVVLLINRQAASQTRLLLDQATLTTQASLAREESDLQNLALLISQRPTLKQYVEQNNSASINSYLDTLRKSVNLDLLIVCDGDNRLIGASTGSESAELCRVEDQSGYLPASAGHDSLLFATGDVQNTSASYKVFLGKNLPSVLTQLQQETGLLYMLRETGQAIASSNNVLNVSSLPASGEARVRGVDGKIYAINQIVLNSNLDLVGALNVEEQVQTQNELSRTLILGLVFIVLVAFVLALWLSQRISSPLNHLATVAADFSHGNLRSPVTIQSGTWEIGQLANTLEDARVALQHSMDQLQSEKTWVEHILNSIVEGILTMDGQNQITFASAGMSRIAGVELEEMIGQKIDDIFLPVESEISLSNQLPAAGQQQNILVKLQNGQEKLLSISRARLVPPEARSSSDALVIRDVSNEEYIHRFLGDFLANITHEFRTPLAALEASSELLLDNLHELSVEELEELLSSLNLGIVDLQTLIDNLIEAASIEAGRFKVSQRPVAFDSILADALKIILPLAEKYKLRLETTSPGEKSVLVLADHRRTVQVLVNLLSNAVKHSPEYGLIQVKYYGTCEQLCVEVRDQGSGIPLDTRPLLFKRFATLNASAGKAMHGTGLGLSVVKAIVEAQGGEVGLLDPDQADRGASFWFTLPLVKETGQ